MPSELSANYVGEHVPNSGRADEPDRLCSPLNRGAIPSRNDRQRTLARIFGLTLSLRRGGARFQFLRGGARFQFLANAVRTDAGRRSCLTDRGCKRGEPQGDVGREADALFGGELPATGAPAVDLARTVSVADWGTFDYIAGPSRHTVLVPSRLPVASQTIRCCIGHTFPVRRHSHCRARVGTHVQTQQLFRFVGPPRGPVGDGEDVFQFHPIALGGQLDNEVRVISPKGVTGERRHLRRDCHPFDTLELNPARGTLGEKCFGAHSGRPPAPARQHRRDRQT